MLEKRLLITIKLLLYAVLFAPAVVTYFTVYPFLHGKVFWVEIFTEVALGLYTILVFVNREYLPQRTKLFWAVSSFIGAISLSTIFSVDRSASLWGDWSRMTGLAFYLHLFIFFVIFSSIIRKESERRGYLIFFSLLGTILSAFAWIQRYNTKFLRAAWVGGRVGSTLDNPAFFAIFLIFIIFINLWLFLLFRKDSKKWRWFFLGTAIFNLCTIFITQTRGVILGTLVGIFLFLGWKFLISSPKFKFYTLGALIVFAIFYSASFFQNFLRSLPGLGRVLESTMLDQTFATRLLTWKIAWQAFLERPVVGWGHEAFYAAFNKFYNPEFVRYSFAETWFDKSHNIFLDLLSMNGILGLVSYIVIFIFGFFAIRQIAGGYLKADDKTSFEKLLIALYISFAIAYFVSNFFEFDTPASLLAIFFVFALLNSRDPKLQIYPNDPNIYRNTKKHHSPSSAIAIIIVFVLLLWFIPLKSLKASIALDEAGNVAEKVDVYRGIELYRNAILKKIRFFEPATLEYAVHLSTIFQERDDAFLALRPHYDLAMGTLQKIVKSHPYDVNYGLAFASLANALATKDAAFAEQAEQMLEGFRVTVNPQRQQILLMLGETKLVLDKTEEAIALIHEAQELATTSKHTAYRLAVAYFAGGYEHEGFAQLKKARILGMDESGAGPLLVLISVNASKGNWSKVAELYEQAVKLEPKNAKLFAQMATAYATIGNRQRAVEAVKRAIELDPNLKIEGERLIYELQRR